MIGIGALLMLLVMLNCGRYYNIPFWKQIILTTLLAITGLVGTKILAFIEAGNWNGRSFFGAVLFTPLLMIFVSVALRVNIISTLDLCAPCECIMLASMKVGCILNDCCIGRILYVTEFGKQIRFPSQIIECVNALALAVLLIVLIKRGKHSGIIYLIYMIIYGGSRFVLNLLRETVPFIWILPAGNFWSLVSILIGIGLMVYHNKSISNSSKNRI